jgi:hypothetical protein
MAGKPGLVKQARVSQGRYLSKSIGGVSSPAQHDTRMEGSASAFRE